METNDKKWVNKPYTPQELEQKVAKVRQDVAKKLNNWSNRLVIAASSPESIENKKEGDTWIDSVGKRWVVKNGVPQSITKIQDARMPLFCPNCSRSMNHKHDRKFYYLRGMCFSCNIEWETNLRIEGKWQKFEQDIMRENERSFLRDKIQEHITYIQEFKEPTLYFESGEFEILAKKEEFQKVFDDLEKDIEFMFARLERISIEEKENI